MPWPLPRPLPGQGWGGGLGLVDWAAPGGPTQFSPALPPARRRYLSCPWCWRGPEAAGRDSTPLPRHSLSAWRHPRRSRHLSPRYCPPAARIHNHRCWSFSGSSRGDSWASPETRKEISLGDEWRGGRWEGRKERFFFF